MNNKTDDMAESTQFFQVNDVIQLEEYGQSARVALINGEDYMSCMSRGGNYVFFGFEENIMLQGGCNFGYYAYDLPVHKHQKAFAAIESLRLGEVMIDLQDQGENIRIARCIETEGALVVTDVSCDEHYFEPIYIRKGENGKWQSSEKLWYIIHYDVDGETYKEYARIYCAGEQP